MSGQLPCAVYLELPFCFNPKSYLPVLDCYINGPQWIMPLGIQALVLSPLTLTVLGQVTCIG